MFGGVLRDARRAAGLTQERVAEAAGVDRIQVSRYEREVQSPTVETLRAIGAAIGVRPSALLVEYERRLAAAGADAPPLRRRPSRRQDEKRRTAAKPERDRETDSHTQRG